VTILPFSLYLYLVRNKLTGFSDLKLKLLQCINLTLYFFLAMGLSLASMGKIDMLHTFVAGMVFVVATLHIPLFTMSAMILLLSLGYVVLLPNYLFDTPMRMAMSTNVMTFSFIAWIIGIMSNRTRIRSFILLKTLERKNLELEDLSHKDTMTHFYNHTSILRLIKHHAEMAHLENKPLVLLILDLDDFKNVNDTYGHPIGDKVLAAIAEVLRNHTRSSDIIGRYGGEEFVVLFPHTKLEDAYRVSERIREAIANSELNGIRITVSGGLCTYEGQDVSEFIQLADDFLYVAKKMGKNRIVTNNA